MYRSRNSRRLPSGVGGETSATSKRKPLRGFTWRVDVPLHLDFYSFGYLPGDRRPLRQPTILNHLHNPITHWWFPENRGTPYHPFVNGFSIVNLPFLDSPFMETPMAHWTIKSTCSPCLGYVGSPHAARPPARPHDLV